MDIKDLEEHYREFYKIKVKTVRYRVPDQSVHLAEEAVQEAYTRALKWLPQCKGEFGPWFNTILNRTVNEVKTIEREKGVTKDVEDELSPEPLTKDLRNLISYRLELENNDTKEIVNLFFLTGLKSKDISEIVGKSHSAVRKVISRFSLSIREVT